MSGRRPLTVRSGRRKSPSSTSTLRALKLIRSGAIGSLKRKTMRPRILSTTSGWRVMPRSIAPSIAGAIPSSDVRPTRTGLGFTGGRGYRAQ